MWDTVLTFDLIIVTSDLIILIFELIILTLYSITLTLNDHFDLLIHNLDLHLRIATILFHKYDWSFFFIMSCIIMTFYFINMILKPYNYDFNQAFFSLTCRDTLPDVPAVKNTWTDLRGDKRLKASTNIRWSWTWTLIKYRSGEFQLDDIIFCSTADVWERQVEQVEQVEADALMWTDGCSLLSPLLSDWLVSDVHQVAV